MTLRLRPALFLLAALLSCADGTAPSVDLSGAWTTGMVPSGAYSELYLTTTGQSVSGTARQQYGLSNGRLVTHAVTGQISFGTFTLTLTADSGSVATFAGRVSDADKLTGTWSAGGSSWTLSFLRFGP
jgi:hypothetical protein